MMIIIITITIITTVIIITTHPSMQSCWDNRSCLFKMLQSPPLIATAAPPQVKKSIPWVL